MTRKVVAIVRGKEVLFKDKRIAKKSINAWRSVGLRVKVATFDPKVDSASDAFKVLRKS